MKKKDIATIALLLLTTILFGLKMTISPGISWWWVFAPLWIPCIIGILAFVSVVVYFELFDK